MRTARVHIPLNAGRRHRPRSQAALAQVDEQLRALTTAQPLSPIRFAGYDSREPTTVAVYEADYPDDAVAAAVQP